MEIGCFELGRKCWLFYSGGLIASNLPSLISPWKTERKKAASLFLCFLGKKLLPTADRTCSFNKLNGRTEQLKPVVLVMFERLYLKAYAKLNHVGNNRSVEFFPSSPCLATALFGVSFFFYRNIFSLIVRRQRSLLNSCKHLFITIHSPPHASACSDPSTAQEERPKLDVFSPKKHSNHETECRYAENEHIMIKGKNTLPTILQTGIHRNS